MDDLQRKAIKAALDHDWDESILINKKLQKVNPDDIDTLLRLCHSYFSKGEIKTALGYAKRGLKKDKNNKLALKLIEKCKGAKNMKLRKDVGETNLKAFSDNYGNTKLVKLVHIGAPSVLVSLIPGEELVLLNSKSKATIETTEKLHVGRLPDDISVNIWSNRDKRHEVIFKSFEGSNVVVILRECGRVN